MPAKNYLSLSEKKNLQEAIRREKNAKIRERILMLLLLNEGKTYQEIADFLGCSRRRVAYWCFHGAPANLKSLQDRKKKLTIKKQPRSILNYS